MRRAALLLPLALAACSNIFGISDWEDPPLRSVSSSSGGQGGGGGEGGGAEGGNSPLIMCLSDPVNATCSDCKINGLETDVDCGGDACGPCDTGKHCNWDTDCQSGFCGGGTCGDAPQPPPCVDGGDSGPNCADCVQNGLETDVDCGGDACSPCASGQHCIGDGDCGSLVCKSGTCS